VHRDLKLENILLDKNENVKLCDFGFTREYEGKKAHLQTFCGTICYSAPEMLRAEKYAGEKVDVWSLGIILYALLTGELPFDDDDELVTKHKILSAEPKYPDTLPPDGKALIAQLLSKRPLHRPTLADILTNPFLANHAPAQQAILKLAQPAPFTTAMEKDTLQRMRSAGIDIDKVIGNVLAQRCDPLAGWWALLIEKEERKERRREQKRKERETDAKGQRRISASSGRLEHLANTLKEVDEEEHAPSITDKPRSRGRRERRSFPSRRLCELDQEPRLTSSSPNRDTGIATTARRRRSGLSQIRNSTTTYRKRFHSLEQLIKTKASAASKGETCIPWQRPTSGVNKPGASGTPKWILQATRSETSPAPYHKPTGFHQTLVH